MSAWLKQGSRVELLVVWEFERISGRKHHGLALPSTATFHELLRDLLGSVGLSSSDVRDIWGTPGLGSGAHDMVAAAVPHLLGAMLSDTRHFFDGQVLGLAVDDTPDSVVQHKPQHWYAGGYAERGALPLFPIESPAKLYSAASRVFRMREGTLMALATASTTRLPASTGNPFADLEIHRRQMPDGGSVDEETAWRLQQLLKQPRDGGLEDVDGRALVHRSILAAPRTTQSRTALNNLKKRQWWRPVAPIVLADHMPTWFEGDCLSPYMLRTFTIRPGQNHFIPAVAHLDGSARVQTVSPHDDEGLYRLISAFAAKTGVPMLANTSLNDNNEPIIETGVQAMNFCLRKCIYNIRIKIKNHEAYPEGCPLRRRASLFSEPTARTNNREDQEWLKN